MLLGFVVIVSWEKFDEAENVVGQEASARTMYRDSAVFPPPIRNQIHADVRNYAATVVRTEWPAMAKGEPGSPEAARVVDEISEHLAAIRRRDSGRAEQYKGIEADRFNDLVTARSTRLDFSEQGVPWVLWAALIVGAVVTIGFVMIFGLRECPATCAS